MNKVYYRKVERGGFNMYHVHGNKVELASIKPKWHSFFIYDKHPGGKVIFKCLKLATARKKFGVVTKIRGN